MHHYPQLEARKNQIEKEKREEKKKQTTNFISIDFY